MQQGEHPDEDRDEGLYARVKSSFEAFLSDEDIIEIKTD